MSYGGGGGGCGRYGVVWCRRCGMVPYGMVGGRWVGGWWERILRWRWSGVRSQEVGGRVRTLPGDFPVICHEETIVI